MYNTMFYYSGIALVSVCLLACLACATRNNYKNIVLAKMNGRIEYFDIFAFD